MLLAACGVSLVLLAVTKAYAIDEFQYSHAAWLVAQGQVPYKDFFEFHFPLPYQVLALPLTVLPSSPLVIGCLRIAMLGVTGLLFLSIRRMLQPFATWVCVSTLGLALTSRTLAGFLVEVRPDLFAIAFFFASVALLSGNASSRRAFWSGLGFGLGVWSSQKAVIYGVVFAVGLLIDLARRRRGTPWVAFPLAWLGGVATVAGLVACYLTATGSWNEWFDCAVRWAAWHERHYPRFSWATYLLPTLREAPHLVVLALVGVLAELRERPKLPRLMLLAWPAALASYFVAKAPFAYALLPFLLITCVLAGRGAAWAIARLRSRLARFGILAFVLGALTVCAWVVPRQHQNNQSQRELLAALGRLTSVNDPVYDGAGAATARPHVGFRYYTNALIREREAATLTADVSKAIVESGCTAMIRDLRYPGLPKDLRLLLETHFQPYSADLWLWGQHIDTRANFLAVRSAVYFVGPSAAFRRVRVDGVPLKADTVGLARGTHLVEVDGDPIDLLWLPRNGERYVPKRGLPPTFSILF